jgi:hypothetical protein
MTKLQAKPQNSAFFGQFIFLRQDSQSGSTNLHISGSEMLPKVERRTVLGGVFLYFHKGGSGKCKEPWNRFQPGGIDSWVPLTFTNTGSDFC